jgi:rubrerythrin
MKWMCNICLYIVEGEAPPEECPLCGAPKPEFKQVP